MSWILPNIVTLTQYLEVFPSIQTSERRCPRCKGKVWKHGVYPRQADRLNPSNQSVNPVYIQRTYCPRCRRTGSILPECIPARRWYLWNIQQAALTLLLAGKSIRAIAKEILPSRQAISRWVARFKEQLAIHRDALCSHWVDLGRASDFIGFWKACLDDCSLAKAMRLCHVAGVCVP